MPVTLVSIWELKIYILVSHIILMEAVKEIIELLNPWWKDNEISKELAKPYKRKIFDKISNLLNYRQIIILSGLRRVGKTTLLYQVIEHLLKKYDSKPK
mgnify:CR=1 FL=1